MSWPNEPIIWTLVPGNSGFVIPYDSTRDIVDLSAVALSAGSAYLAPGRKRSQRLGAVYGYTVKCTGQNVVVDEQLLTGVAGVAADWETQGPGTFTVTAGGTTIVRNFKPLGRDHRLLVTAGGTGPTTLIIEGFVINAPGFGL